jgi:hypothetical protein
MDRDAVYEICKEVAPAYGYNPLMLLAQIEQESTYKTDEPRLEQGFFSRYIRNHPVYSKKSPAVKVMLSSSYGLGQLMGETLVALKWLNPADSTTTSQAIDAFVKNPELQVELMCEWLKVKQGLGDSHALADALRRYNGGGDPEYVDKVTARYLALKKVYP